MKEIIEEYGGIIWAALAAVFAISVLSAILFPGNPLYTAVHNLWTASLP